MGGDRLCKSMLKQTCTGSWEPIVNFQEFCKLVVKYHY